MGNLCLHVYQLPMYQQICCMLSILPEAKYVAYATSLPMQHQLCCYSRVYGKESKVYNNHVYNFFSVINRQDNDHPLPFECSYC